MQLVMTDQSGTKVLLGDCVGKGGEGAVYKLGSDSALVAKVYHKPLAPLRVNKLRAMTSGNNADVTKFAAWPQALLSNGGEVRGFVMRRVDGRDIHELYNPKTRRSEFPSADFRFLVRTAANVARAFAAIHARGCVIGDVNHGSVKVSTAATTTLIDCDSFQIADSSRTYFCEVGVGPFTPPEVQGKDFSSFARTPNHDLFGLAVLIFQLLMMGRHPFAGRYSGPGDMTIEKAIGEYRFAYGKRSRQMLMEPPPHSLPLSALSPEVEGLFEAAFSQDAGARNSRPTAERWIASLHALETNLQRCADDAGHYYPRHLGSCPWCQVEKALGVILFGIYVNQAATGPQFNLTAVWAKIERVPSPPPQPTLPRFDASSFPPSQEVGAEKARRIELKIVALLAIGLGIAIAMLAPGAGFALVAGLLGGWWIWPGDNSEIKKRLKEAERAAAVADDAMDARWERETSSKPFADKLAELIDAKGRLVGLPKLKQDKLNSLNANRERAQRERFLERFVIQKEKISGIGPGRKALLNSYGIIDAADVIKHQVMQVPGFGDALAEKLVRWRRSVEANFRFNPSLGVDKNDIAQVEREISNLKQKYENQLATGARELEALSRRITATRERLWPERVRTAEEHAKARHYLQSI